MQTVGYEQKYIFYATTHICIEARRGVYSTHNPDDSSENLCIPHSQKLSGFQWISNCKKSKYISKRS